MARKQADVPHELDPLKGGLKHHPFAALREKLGATELPSAAAVDGEQPKNGEGASDTMREARTSSAAHAKGSVAHGLSNAHVSTSGNIAHASTLGNARALAPARDSNHAPGAAPKPAAVQPRERITVRMERTGRGGKTVTIAEGPAFAGLPLEALARDIARGMGTGARAKGEVIIVQGDLRERLVTWLGERSFPGAVAGN
jgi:translation initiation factor 1